MVESKDMGEVLDDMLFTGGKLNTKLLGGALAPDDRQRRASRSLRRTRVEPHDCAGRMLPDMTMFDSLGHPADPRFPANDEGAGASGRPAAWHAARIRAIAHPSSPRGSLHLWIAGQKRFA
jgi:hypothetical protein